MPVTRRLNSDSNGINVRIYIDSPSVARGLRYFSTQELSRVEKYRNPHGQLKENLFLPLFNTNFISKSFGGPLHNSVARTRGKAQRVKTP